MFATVSIIETSGNNMGIDFVDVIGNVGFVIVVGDKGFFWSLYTSISSSTSKTVIKK